MKKLSAIKTKEIHMSVGFSTPVILLLAIVLVCLFTFSNFQSGDSSSAAAANAAASQAQVSDNHHRHHREGRQNSDGDAKQHSSSSSSSSPPVVARPLDHDDEPTQQEIAPSPIDAAAVFGSLRAVERTRENACATVNDDNKDDAPAINDSLPAVVADEELTPTPVDSKKHELFALPACPEKFKLFTNDSTDRESMDRRTNWVLSKYNLYAKRCKMRNGIMWAKLTHPQFFEIMKRVSKVIAPAAAASPSRKHEPYALLDWGCGCGVGLEMLSQMFHNKKGPGANLIGSREFFGLGIDLIAGAVEFARRSSTMADLQQNGHLRFCHADGTNLRFLPSNFFDSVIAFGALLHLPKPTFCTTLAQLLRVVKRGGVISAQYIDDAYTVQLLSECSFTCSPGQRVEMTIVREDVWLKGLLPKANAARKSKSIIWKKF